MNQITQHFIWKTNELSATLRQTFPVFIEHTPIISNSRFIDVGPISFTDDNEQAGERAAQEFIESCLTSAISDEGDIQVVRSDTFLDQMSGTEKIDSLVAGSYFYDQRVIVMDSLREGWIKSGERIQWWIDHETHHKHYEANWGLKVEVSR